VFLIKIATEVYIFGHFNAFELKKMCIFNKKNEPVILKILLTNQKKPHT